MCNFHRIWLKQFVNSIFFYNYNFEPFKVQEINNQGICCTELNLQIVLQMQSMSLHKRRVSMSQLKL